MKKAIIAVALYFFHFSNVSGDTIYQWSDPWGQIQYSKNPVPGAMISDLTELPEPQETTEQQKQEAMIRKLQKMKQSNLGHAQTEATREILKRQKLEAQNHCEQLRSLMVDVQFANFRQFSFPGTYFFPNHYSHLQFDLAREIRNKCR